MSDPTPPPGMKFTGYNMLAGKQYACFIEDHLPTESACAPLESGFDDPTQNPKKYPACKGTNCGCTDGWSHSPECKVELEEACNPGGIYNEPTPEPQGSAVEWVKEHLWLQAKTRPDQMIGDFLPYADALELARRCDAAERRLVTAERNLVECEASFDIVNAGLRAQLAAAQAEAREYKALLEQIPAHTHHAAVIRQMARAALAKYQPQTTTPE